MLGITVDNIQHFNKNLKYESPAEIISFALELAKNPVLTTSFGTYSELMIQGLVKQKEDIPIIWVDTGLNHSDTYVHADDLSTRYNLNVHRFSPLATNAYLNHRYGKPRLGNPNHFKLTQILKKEPIERAFKEFNPDIWFTNIRATQTEFRAKQDILSFSPAGILKVSPFYHFSKSQIKDYAKKHGLNLSQQQLDPIKAKEKRECGIHFTN